MIGCNPSVWCYLVSISDCCFYATTLTTNGVGTKNTVTLITQKILKPFLGDTPIQIVMCNLTKNISFPVSCQLSSLMHIHIDNRFGLKMKQTTEWLLLFFVISNQEKVMAALITVSRGCQATLFASKNNVDGLQGKKYTFLFIYLF